MKFSFLLQIYNITLWQSFSSSFVVISTLFSSGPLTYENKSKLPKYEIPESLKHTSESATSDSLSQRLEELEEDEDQEMKSEKVEQKTKEEESSGENDPQQDIDVGK